MKTATADPSLTIRSLILVILAAFLVPAVGVVFWAYNLAGAQSTPTKAFNLSCRARGGVPMVSPLTDNRHLLCLRASALISQTP